MLSSIGFLSEHVRCVYSHRGTAGNLEEFCVFTWTTHFCGGSGSLFSKALTNLRHRFPIRKWQVGEVMFCGSKHVQNKDNKEIMISQTEFAVKVTKNPMFLARKKMRDDPADEAEVHAFRGVNWQKSVGWLVKQVRTCLVKCHNCRTVAQACGSNLVVRRVHQHANMGLVGSQGGYICGVTDKSLLEGRDAPWSPMAWRSFKMSRTVPSSLGAEAQAMSVALGFVGWATLFLQELIHGQFDLQGAPAVMQERPPVHVTDCKSLYDHLSAVGSPSTLHDRRSAIDVLILRESMKKTGSVIRRAPTGLQLADGLTKDKGEAVECLRRILRSGSYMLCEEQVMQERHMTGVQKLPTCVKSPTAEKS